MILPLRIHCFVLFATILRLKMAWRVLAILLNYTMRIIKSFPKIYRNSLNVASRRRFFTYYFVASSTSEFLLCHSQNAACFTVFHSHICQIIDYPFGDFFSFFIVSYFFFRESRAFHLLIYCVGKLLFPLLVLKDQSLRLRIF